MQKGAFVVKLKKRVSFINLFKGSSHGKDLIEKQISVNQFNVKHVLGINIARELF